MPDDAIERARAEAEFWKRVALRAAQSIDALLLYATAYPTDSHALDGYALLGRMYAELGEFRLPRTYQTFEHRAAGRSLMPPFPERQSSLAFASQQVSEKAGVTKAATNPLAKLDECDSHIANMREFVADMLRVSYSGPQYGEELEALRAMLDAAPSVTLGEVG